ncbi:unnamed protein product [Parnassius apollo]|uniref:(apollo) hypothetical protein n=1 Tax=Parnassius apollo TaxID=110799 RepID=A0A8S3WVA5_PARAO|nr:unnamed protein product [Parnassius apollo]
MCIKGVNLITFDATNTLLRFRIHPWQYYSIVARDYGFKGSENDLKPRLLENYKAVWNEYPNFGKGLISWEDWWSHVVKRTFKGQLPKSADVNRLCDKLINDFKTTKCWRLADGADKILNMLRNQGISLGVISNFDPRLVEILQNMQIYNKFHFVLTSFDIGYPKPNRKMFDRASIACENVHPRACLHIGDDIEKDYKAARSAGWHALLVTNQKLKDNSIVAKHIFVNLDELHDAICNDKVKL